MYDLIAADTEWVNQGGKWNQYEIKSINGHVTFIQNGHKIVETDMWDEHWRDMIRNTQVSLNGPGSAPLKKAILLSSKVQQK